MSNFQYDEATFASAIARSREFKSQAQSTENETIGIVNRLKSPSGLDIESEKSSLRNKINALKTRSIEINNDIESIKDQIINSDSAIKSNMSHLIDNEVAWMSKTDPNFIKLNINNQRDSSHDVIMATKDLPLSTKIKNGFKNCGAKIYSTVQVSMDKIGEGVMKPFAQTLTGANMFIRGVGNKIWFDLLGNETLNGRTKEQDYSSIEKQSKYIKEAFVDPISYTYKDGAGVERYKGLYQEARNSTLDINGKVANYMSTGAEFATNIATLAAGGVGIAANTFRIGGDATNRVLDEGNHIDGDTINYVLAREAIGVGESILDRTVLNKIPQAKSISGKFGNIALGGATNAPETLINSILQKATYKSDKNFSSIFNENGGLKQTGIDFAIGAGFTAGGEVISGVTQKVMSNIVTNKMIDNYINPKYKTDNTGMYVVDDILNTISYDWNNSIPSGNRFSFKEKKDMFLNMYKNNHKYVPSQIDIENMINNQIKSDIKDTLSKDFKHISYFKDVSDVFDEMNIDQYLKNTGKKVLLKMGNSKILGENLYEQNNIIKSYYSIIDDASVLLNKFNGENGLTIRAANLMENSLILTEDNFKKNSRPYCSAYNQPISPGKSINVFNPKYMDIHNTVHEGTHMVSHSNEYSGFHNAIKDEFRGINEGATEFLTIRATNCPNNGGYSSIVKVFDSLDKALENNGRNGIEEIGKAYYKHNTYDLMGMFEDIFDDYDEYTKTWTAFRKNSDIVANQGNGDMALLLNAEHELDKISNRILEITAQK